MSLSVVIPTFNEAGSLRLVAEEMVTSLRRHVELFEVIFVDDGSKDETPSILSGLAQRFPEIRVIRHSANAGYGAS